MDGELKQIAEEAITVKPNFAYSAREIQEDITRIFDRGYFEQCKPTAEDTRDGVKLTIAVRLLYLTCWNLHIGLQKTAKRHYTPDTRHNPKHQDKHSCRLSPTQSLEGSARRAQMCCHSGSLKKPSRTSTAGRLISRPSAAPWRSSTDGTRTVICWARQVFRLQPSMMTMAICGQNASFLRKSVKTMTTTFDHAKL